jgi:hypothetical protein
MRSCTSRRLCQGPKCASIPTTAIAHGATRTDPSAPGHARAGICRTTRACGGSLPIAFRGRGCTLREGGAR